MKKLIKKFPTVWGKMTENHRGDFLDSHCTDCRPILTSY